MKIFSVIKPSLFKNSRPQEDYFIVSKKHPIFVVADGVSLKFDEDSSYPKNSGAAEVAKIFCEVVMLQAGKRYDNFKQSDLMEIFNLANKAVAEYNISQGLTKDAINYWDVDLFSATTSFVLIKDNKAYWWSLCDSGVAWFNDNAKKSFFSPPGWDIFKKNLPDNWKDMTKKEKTVMQHHTYRNAVNEKGELTGYGVADGEDDAKLYLNAGVLNINAGNLVFLYTDGFENYFSVKEFINLFKLWPEDIGAQLENIIEEKSKAELPKYGQEKTLIAISI